MIREVFNALTGSAGKVPQQGMAGNETANVSPGFFGKMLMALQDQNGEQPNGEQKEKQPSLQFGMTPAYVGSQQTELEKQPIPLMNPETEAPESQKLFVGVVKLDQGDEENQTKRSEANPEEQSSNIPATADESQTSEETTNLDSVKAEETELQSEEIEQEPEETNTSDEEVQMATSEEESSASNSRAQEIQQTVAIESSEPESQETNNTATQASPTIDSKQQATEAISSEQDPPQTSDAQKAPVQQNTEHTVEVKSEATITMSGTENQEIKSAQEEKAPVESDPKNSEQKVEQARQPLTATNPQNETLPQDNGMEVKKQVGEKEVKAANNLFANQNREASQERTQTLQSQALKEDVSFGEDAQDSLKTQVKMKGQQAQEEREKRYDMTRSSSDGNSISGERLQPVMGTNASGQHQQNMSFSGQPNWLKFQVAAQQNSSITEDQQAFMNEQVTSASSEAEVDEAEQTGINMNRLSDVPIANATLRRSILPGLTSSIQRAATEGKENPQMWQKHSFEMEDGNRIELSTRNVDGVIQVKIASSSPELSKLMQQYGQEIREHLEKECEVNIDLQFNDGQENEMSGFFGDNDSQGRGREGLHGGSGSNSDRSADQKSKEHIQQAVRKFGYNQMEWTA